MKLLVFGGTFDPVHDGHLRAARAALERTGADRLLFVPAYAPPHKDPGSITPYEDRLALLAAALSQLDDPRLGVCEVERLEGTRYTVETLERIEKKCGGEVAFLVGSDSLRDLPDWRDAERLVRRHRIYTVARDRHDDRRSLEAVLRGRLPDPLVDRLLDDVLDVEPLELSATTLRARLARGERPTDALPPAVLREIERRGLYGRSPAAGSSGSIEGRTGERK